MTSKLFTIVSDNPISDRDARRLAKVFMSSDISIIPKAAPRFIREDTSDLYTLHIVLRSTQ